MAPLRRVPGLGLRKALRNGPTPKQYTRAAALISVRVYIKSRARADTRAARVLIASAASS